VIFYKKTRAGKQPASHRFSLSLSLEFLLVKNCLQIAASCEVIINKPNTGSFCQNRLK
jgi:hypothetical protein